ncbi:MAG: hypothetical protein EPN48_04750 [Microbacteriaceae bacterium]|nr:MAG: hypothetical protein EPN48_04750 [Microbacteriaceae bacterium]
MPSFRVTMTIGALAPGVAPTQVVPVAEGAAAQLTTVEASDVAVVSGAARVTVRFTADDAELAQQIAQHTADTTGAVAEVLAWRLAERVGGGWYNR